jgi:hypothetical protein
LSPREGCGVVANGGLTYTERDLSLSASGADDLRVVRSWRSALATGWGHYGRGWYDGATLSSLWPADDGSVTWISPGGSDFRYTPNGDAYNTAANTTATLCQTSVDGCSDAGQSGAYWRLDDPATNTSSLYYDSGQMLAQIDSHGNTAPTRPAATRR